MDTATAVVTIVTAQTCALLGLLLRLRRRVRPAQIQDQSLTDMAKVITHGGQLEFNEERGAGRRPRMTLTHTQAPTKGRAA
ncbi:hypothetical protein J2853_009561 [Streptosporangium lutulentum]|uniref:Uncharacterized protein n=1 Tax=Streptosporangium lutulentum TaxID=1461250 RepID=A0ABT9QV12_9ACTN|nr:hypothetical protein [Streptosporangium lutulentum]